MQFVSAPGGIRDMFSRTDKEKIPPDLKRALTLLNLSDFAGVEERFLATTAFLEPWAVFRDAVLLVNNTRNTEPSSITRLDILWFYTQFDEGIRRHDPRAEKTGSHFEIDKRGWSSTEFEKHLHAWLLQSFFVGKAYSPFGFRYFELKNICAAWEEVFVPIIKAVRASYSVKGRRHYGRLALFIEDRCPSRLAFPEGNITMPDGVVTSPTPFRMVSRPSHLRGASQTVLTKKNYDEAERELRNVYPQYGGLVERPKFKQNVGEWLEEQRVRAMHRKTIVQPEAARYVPKYHPQVLKQSEQEAHDRPPEKNNGSRSPIKRCSDSIRRSLSGNVSDVRIGKATHLSTLEPTRPKAPDTPKGPLIPYGLYSYVPRMPKQEPKSPLHGITRQIHVPDDVSDRSSQSTHPTAISLQNSPGKDDAWPLPAPPLPRPELSQQRTPDQRAYISIRNSNPFNEVTHEDMLNVAHRRSVDSEGSRYSPMGALSAIPRPLNNDNGSYNNPSTHATLQTRELYSHVRRPSYEGNGYQEEVSLTNLHARKISDSDQSSVGDEVPLKPRGRLPAPINVPPPYINQLRVVSNDTYHNDSPPNPQAVPWPGNSPPKPVAWPGFEDSPHCFLKAASAIAPPIPAKSAERWALKRGQRSEQILHEETHSHEMTRIVSRENIRAALGDLSQESSMEDLKAHPAARAKNAPSRVASPPRLETYNTHMFPRKDAHHNGDSGR
ncbi:uncharacterized protein EKO05_0008951 [Ascochyta rabiei]|uniref:Uncharacterized protein n=1 Tax=Didymella rabiei TaxID=5454 RepID=A0A163HVB0_DIDRA|nr:uncharacterized protein EKO05_0008951 [Ascochyta rabiei]KZM25493.1 hypothetical protein ST47_g3355 [Ascochyta rabiei]UPX18659.1 hypothetical protein EKO05_0008951 [Ascochyta rabiei]